MQLYIARDLLPDYVAVNKRVPLRICGIAADECGAVRARLISLYGAETEAEVTTDDGKMTVSLGELPERFLSVDIGGQELTERRRFDFSDLAEIMKRLRGEGGCEWDRAQDHKSIRINLIEEAYELVEAIDRADVAGMLEESGHIFGANHADNAEQALVFWNEAKKKEKKYTSHTDAMDRVPKNLPALLYAEKVQKVAKRAGFDWSDFRPAAEKVSEELAEFLAAPKEHMTEEGGDLLFAAVNLLRLKKVEAETALREASAKFFRRFAAVEDAVKAQGRDMTELPLAELDKIWDEVKASEKEVE